MPDRGRIGDRRTMTVVSERAFDVPISNGIGADISPVARKHGHAVPGSVSSTKGGALEGRLVFAFSFLLFLAIAILLDFEYHVYPPDAVSRMANGFYVLFSRHPHLAAIGFVWNPLQSVFDMVPLLVKPLWPAVASNDFAGSLVSVLCMSGAAFQIHECLREMGTGRAPRLLLTLFFVCNPMIAYYGANGMSEALYIFTAVATARYLQRWSRSNDTASLVYSAVALGACYLARNEAAGIAIIAGAFVVLRSLTVSSGVGRLRVMSALTDATVFLLPVITAFVAWAFTSYVITGEPFQQFTSQYGNTAELSSFGSSYGVQPGHEAMRIRHEFADLGHLAPLLPVILVLALLLAWKRSDWQLLAPIAVLGGGLSFDMFSYLEDQVFPWYRFYILCIPLSILLTGFLLAPKPRERIVEARSPSFGDPSRAGGRSVERRFLRGSIALAATAAVVVLIGPSLVTTGTGMLNPRVGIEESFQIGFIVHEKGAETAAQRATSVPMLGYIEQLNLSDGSVVTDEDLAGCATTMIVRSTNPKIFVIPNDTDFQRILADPFTFHAKYMLAPVPTGDDAGIAISTAYPTLYRNGAGFATLVKSFPATALCPPYRLYRVNRHPNSLG
jgi:hypothetical protein